MTGGENEHVMVSERWLAIVAGVSALAAVIIYAISEYHRRREIPAATPSPAS
jgi:hypothetical protein